MLRLLSAWAQVTISVLAGLALAGCGAAPEDAPHWLIGRWATDGETCDRAWLVYSRDGTWQSASFRGRWRLEGNRLHLVATEDHMPGHYVDPAKRGWTPFEAALCHTEIVSRGDDGEIRSRWEDGTTAILRRCGGGRAKGVCVGDCSRTSPFDPPYVPASRPRAARICPGRQ